MQEPLGLRLLNGLSKGLPFWTWQKTSLLKPREWMAHLLGMGNIKLAGVMPSGHFGILMPQRIYFINHTQVRLDGVDLGEPTKVSPNPSIGNFFAGRNFIAFLNQNMFSVRYGIYFLNRTVV